MTAAAEPPPAVRMTLQYIAGSAGIVRTMTFGGVSPGESTIKFYEEFPLNLPYLRNRVGELFCTLRVAAGAAGGGEGELARIRALGLDLYRELVPAPLRAKLFAAAGGDLVLAIDSSLAWIPWELLFDGERFLCRGYNLGRIVSLPMPAAVVEKRPARVPVEHVTIADPEGDLPGAAREGIETRNFLLPLRARARPVLLAGRVGVAGFMDALKSADVLHFAGHLEGVDADSLIRLAGGSLSASQIAKLCGRFPLPGVVFLNGCASSAVAAAPSVEGGHRRAFGLASSFLMCGVRHFAGTLWDVRDAAAAAAGLAFLKGLYAGLGAGAALRAARESAVSECGEAAAIWAAYVLYGDPSVAPAARPPDHSPSSLCSPDGGGSGGSGGSGTPFL